MAQNNQLTIGGRKRTHHYFYFYPPLFPFTLLLRGETFALERKLVTVAFGPVDQGSFTPGVPAQVINRRVMCNLVNPGRKFKLRTIARKRPIDLNEDFLG